MRLTDLELRVLVRGRPITEYPYRDKVFVEGRAGSEYEIEVRNHSTGRIEAVVSVDGLSVIDGQPAGSGSRGYLLRAGDTLRIPGWTLDTSNVAKFAFATKPDSYATQMTGSEENNGVIGVMAFREHPYLWPSVGQPIYRGWASTGYTSPIITNSTFTPPAAPPGASYATMNATNAATDFTTSTVTANLGTAFSNTTGFSVHSVSFNRGFVLGTLMLYYDDRRGLKARGIHIGRRRVVTEEPQAFPAGFCAPPPGWRG